MPRGSRQRRRWPVRARLLLRAAIAFAVVALSLVPLGPLQRLNPFVAAQLFEPDTCVGDERITVAPTEPLADEELLVAVSSSRQHRGVWLAGAEHTVQFRDYSGQLGYVWNWTLTPKFAGPLRLRFFVDSTTLCAETVIIVAPSAHAEAAAQALPVAPVVIRVRRSVSGSSAGHDNGNDNSSDNNSSGRSHKFALPRPPEIASILPAQTCPGAVLTITGKNFGQNRQEVGGKVVVSGADVDDFLSWQNGTIMLLVPNSAKTGSNRDVYVINSNGFSHATVGVSSAPC